MTRKRKFDMGTTREADAEVPVPNEVDRFVAGRTTAMEEEPLDRVNFVLAGDTGGLAGASEIRDLSTGTVIRPASDGATTSSLASAATNDTVEHP